MAEEKTSEELLAEVKASVEATRAATGGRMVIGVLLDVEKKLDAVDARIDALTTAVNHLMQARG